MISLPLLSAPDALAASCQNNEVRKTAIVSTATLAVRRLRHRFEANSAVILFGLSSVGSHIHRESLQHYGSPSIPSCWTEEGQPTRVKCHIVALSRPT